MPSSTPNRTLELGWQILLQKHPERLLKESTRQTQNVGLVLKDTAAHIVFGSDWGMCGQFNERIAEYTQKYLNYPAIMQDSSPILSIGSKISDRLDAIGYDCEATSPKSLRFDWLK